MRIPREYVCVMCSYHMLSKIGTLYVISNALIAPETEIPRDFPSIITTRHTYYYGIWPGPPCYRWASTCTHKRINAHCRRHVLAWPAAMYSAQQVVMFEAFL